PRRGPRVLLPRGPRRGPVRAPPPRPRRGPDAPLRGPDPGPEGRRRGHPHPRRAGRPHRHPRRRRRGERPRRRGRGGPGPPPGHRAGPGRPGPLRGPGAAPPAVHLLPGRRPVPRAQPVRVLRARRPRGRGLRDAGGGLERGRAAHARRARAHRLPGGGPGPTGLRPVRPGDPHRPRGGRRALRAGRLPGPGLHLVHGLRAPAPDLRGPHRRCPRRLRLSPRRGRPPPAGARGPAGSVTPMSDALTPEELADLEARIDAWAARQREENPVVAAVERDDTSGERRWFLRVRGEEKDVFTIWLHLRQRTLHYETYVMPAPEENAGALYEHLLRRNLKLYGAAFAIGEEDAVFLVGQLAA